LRTFLLLTDTPSRGERLARSLASLGPSVVVDLLDPVESSTRPDPRTVRAVVSDVAFTSSAPLAGLKRHLDRLGPKRPPYLCILHGDSPRARVQAQALGADGILDMDQSVRLLTAALSPLLTADAGPPASLVEDVAGADAALTRIFDLGRGGGVVAPELVAVGAGLIRDALRRSDVRAWLDVVWRFDDATHQHCLLVAGLAAGFAQHLGLRQADSEQLTQAALLHDIGKSRIPLAILNKPGPLSDTEMAVMRTHAALGDEMLRDQGYGPTMHAVVRSHHECLDGSGYPDALTGGAIPDLVRLVTICDTFAALIERRPYKRSMEGGAAYAILTDMGGKLDQDLVRAFLPLAEAAGPTPRIRLG
jgi:putative nucleotidyltransferase with HDIG domain